MGVGVDESGDDDEDDDEAVDDGGDVVKEGGGFGADHCEGGDGYEDHHGYGVQVAVVGIHVGDYYAELVWVVVAEGGEIGGP